MKSIFRQNEHGKTARFTIIQQSRSKVVIDCSGDGDVAVKAGADYVYGDAVTHKAQPGSAMFEMADVDKVYDYICANPDDFEFKTDCVPLRPYDERLKQHYFVAQGGFVE